MVSVVRLNLCVSSRAEWFSDKQNSVNHVQPSKTASKCCSFTYRHNRQHTYRRYTAWTNKTSALRST